MADSLVLLTQQWLNKTYVNVSGYQKVTEDGKTGWPTIYALIHGLQHELGIKELSNNFGDTTKKLYNEKVLTQLKNGYSGNVVYLIQGAFWCKGISPKAFDGVFSNYTQAAVHEFQQDAGFSEGMVFNADWAKALFDMSAFVLVSGGDSTVRAMQQWLNASYYEYFGILPCDGIYQRDTNIALIYALQAEEGLGVGEANGNYGETTTKLTPTLTIGDNSTFTKILQYALYVNGFYLSGPFDGKYTEAVAEAVAQFAGFMMLGANTGVANVTIFKGLLTSNGDTNRSAEGVDTSTQLTDEQVQVLVDNKVRYVGRYLTGTVGSGVDERDKFLTVEEIDRITGAGLSIFPIYQDGGADLNYFNASQGAIDGFTAAEAARKLGIPRGTYIYFAVDIDIQQGDISGTVLPYFTNIYDQVIKYGYAIGVYGTRNICSQVIKNGYATYAFVSDMSTGYSGNLGFPMPQEWAFDQFIEFTMTSSSGSVGIDQVAVSGNDIGFDTIDINESGIPDGILDKVNGVGVVLPLLRNMGKVTITLDQEYSEKNELYSIYVKLSESVISGSGDNVTSYTVSDGKLSNSFIKNMQSLYDFTKQPSNINTLTSLAKIIQKGTIRVDVAPPRAEESGNIGIEISLNIDATDIAGAKSPAYKWTIQIYFNKAGIKASPVKNNAYIDSVEKVIQYSTTTTKQLTAKGVALIDSWVKTVNQNKEVIKVVGVIEGLMLLFEEYGEEIFQFVSQFI